MLNALVASLAMMATDVLVTIEVMAEAREMGWVAGWLDVAAWLVSISCTAITVKVLNGHYPIAAKAEIVVFVSAANLFGTKSGQVLGSRLLSSKVLSRVARRFGAADRPQLTHDEIRQLKLIAAAARSGR